MKIGQIRIGEIGRIRNGIIRIQHEFVDGKDNAVPRVTVCHH